MDNRINPVRNVGRPLPAIMKKTVAPSVANDVVKISGNDSTLAGLDRDQAVRMLMGTGKNNEINLFRDTNKFYVKDRIESGILRMDSPGSVVYSKADNTYYTGLFSAGGGYMSSAKKNLTAMTQKGSVKWTYDNKNMTSEPVIDKKGNVYFRTGDSLVALDGKGNELWECKAGGSGEKRPKKKLSYRWNNDREFEDYAPQLGKDGTVFIMTCDKVDGYNIPKVTAVKDGKEMWSAPADNVNDRGPGFEVKNGLLYVTQVEKKVVKKNFFSSDEVSERNVIACYHPDGTLSHSVDAGGDDSRMWAESSKDSRFMTGDDGSVYVPVPGEGRNHSLIKYAPDGKKEWEKEVKPDPSIPRNDSLWFKDAPVKTRDGNFLLSTIERNGGGMEWTSFIKKMSPDGEVLWSKGYGVLLDSKPLIDERGEIFVKIQTNDGKKEGVMYLDKEGGLRRKYMVSKKDKKQSSIRSMSPNPGGGVILETVNTRERKFQPGILPFVHEREVMVIDEKTSAPKKADAQNSKKKGIKKTDEFVIINGVKLPVHKS